MWACRPTSSTAGDAGGPGERGRGRARGDAEAELRVVLAGPHELVGVGLDARRDAQEHRRDAARPVGHQRLDAVELVERVDHDAPDAVGQRRCAARRRTCCCRAARAGRRARRRRGPRGSSPPVDTSRCMPSSCGQPGHGPAQERLGRVADAGPEGGDRLAAPGPQVRLVVDEQRRAVLARPARACRSRRRAAGRAAPTAAVSGSRDEGWRHRSRFTSTRGRRRRAGRARWPARSRPPRPATAGPGSARARRRRPARSSRGRSRGRRRPARGPRW